jgi:hypothetical protein
MGKFLITIGVLLVVGGLLIQAGFPVGRLPGDIIIRRGGMTFYLPIVTCIVVSIILTLVNVIFRR